MKKSFQILTLLLIFCSAQGQSKKTGAQNKKVAEEPKIERVVIKTPANGHSIGRTTVNGVYNCALLDNETVPFTGKFIEVGFKKELLYEFNYKSGLLHGQYLEYETNKDTTFIKVRANYVKGLLVGKYTHYYTPTRRKMEVTYNKNGEKEGLEIEYGVNDDDKEYVFNTYKYVNGKKDGLWQIYDFMNTKIIRVENYKVGLQHGLSMGYHTNGQKEYVENYVNDNLEGKREEWYDNGNLKRVTNYKNGKKNGTELLYTKSGKLEKEVNYLNGQKKGKFIVYNADGSINEETTF